VIGVAVAGRARLSLRILCTTGRLSSGLICRAYRAGIEAVLSRTSVTELAANAATRLGITLIGYIRADAFTIYTGADRLAITISDAPPA
jgi:FdhD protein